MNEKTKVFCLTLIADGDKVRLHASYSGGPSVVLDVGLSLMDKLAGDDGIPETINAGVFPVAAWVQ